MAEPENDSLPRVLDIARNRRAQKWSHGELLGRALWEYGGALLFSLVPRPFWGVRRALLRAFGATIGQEVHIHPSVRIAVPWNLTADDYVAIGDRAIIYNLGAISLGKAVTVSQGAHLCAGTHDFRSIGLPLVKAPIVIGPGAWVCADAFVGPGVCVGALAVVGARAVATKDVEDARIVAGNPAQVIGIRTLERGA